MPHPSLTGSLSIKFPTLHPRAETSIKVFSFSFLKTIKQKLWSRVAQASFKLAV